jgi:putative ABC transport system permease protein
MFRQALSEVRHHPGRFLATIVAIAISVAFLAGSSVLTATEGQAQGKSMSVAVAEADVVISLPRDASPDRAIGSTIADTAGVALSAPMVTSSVIATDQAVSQVLNLVNVPPEGLRWASLTQGRWPTKADEVALSAGAAKSLSVGVGDRLRAAGGDSSLIVVGLTNEPSGLFAKTGYAADSFFAPQGDLAGVAQTWTVKAAPGTTAEQLVQTLTFRLKSVAPKATVEEGSVYIAKEVASIVADFDVFANILWGFAAIAMVVGMITIANTFAITVAQRRRQVGLLRAVGASGQQVRRRFFAEALILGVVGSLLGLAMGIGIAAGITAWSTALFWGLALPWPQLAAAFGLGLLATVVAAFVPIVRGTRVMPLEALRPSAAETDQRRIPIVRTVICVLLLLGGTALAVVAVVWKDSYALGVAIGAGALISLGVLLGGPLFVPSLLRVVGAGVRQLGTVPRLAADNAERNPKRATATATALMLALGLMITLQVATASLQATVNQELAVQYPVDLQVSGAPQGSPPQSVTSEAIAKLRNIPGVDDAVALPATTATVNKEQTLLVLGYRDGIPGATGITQTVTDDEVLINKYAAQELPKRVTLTAHGRKVTVTVHTSRLVDYDQALVSAATLAKLGSVTPDAVVWLSVPDRTQAVSVMVAAADIAGSQELISGSVPQAAMMEQVFTVLLAITTGLLGVAVLIALVGVGNTLSLSVIERSRESALLRALGLQAGSLRSMLTIEALQVTAVGLLVGLVAGGFFGWLAVTATANSMGLDSVTFAVNGTQTVIMIAVAVGAAALASILPGRRAAKAAPTEALAEV